MGLLARRSATDETDEELVDRVRDGSDDAFAELYRRHRKVAERTAAWLLGSRRDVDDAVADAFAAVLQALRNGNGPKENFRAYLLACVRNGCTLRRSRSITPVTLDPEAAGVALEDPERYVEADTVARAFAALSPRWQQALWMTEVEQRSVADVGAQLGLRSQRRRRTDPPRSGGLRRRPTSPSTWPAPRIRSALPSAPASAPTSAARRARPTSPWSTGTSSPALPAGGHATSSTT